MEYDVNNRLIKYNGETVKYDKDGNMTYGPLNGEMTDFTYDCRNRLIQAGDTKYEYDAENNRIAVIKNAGTDDETITRYTVDSASGELTQVVKSVETDKPGNEKILYYYYADNRLVAQEEYVSVDSTSVSVTDASDVQSPTTSKKLVAVKDTYLTYHFNNVGSTTAVTDKDSSVVFEYKYSPYGDLISGEYGQVSFLYNGQYGVTSDDNGLYYMRARYYNVDIKRFVNQDVLTGSIDSSPSLNRYAYVEGNPVSFLDPFGLEPLVTDGMHTKASILSYAGGAVSLFNPLAGLLIGEIAIFSDIGLYLNNIFTSNFDTEVIQTALFSTLENLGWFTLGYISYWEIPTYGAYKVVVDKNSIENIVVTVIKKFLDKYVWGE